MDLSSIIKNQLKKGSTHLTRCVFEAKETPEPFIFINGFWRSGTTFLMEYMSAVFRLNTLFEPLHPSVHPYSKYFNTETEFRNDLLNPEIKRPDEFMVPIQENRVRGVWTNTGRSFKSQFSANGTLIKLVRGHHVVPALSRDYRLIQISRDAEGVMKSILHSKWTLRFFNDLDLRTALYLSEDKKVYYSRFEPLFDRYTSVADKAVVYKFCLEQFVRDHSDRLLWVDYNELRSKPEEVTQKISKFLNLETNSELISNALTKDSSTTIKASRKVEHLDQKHVETVEKIRSEFQSLLN